MKKFILMGISLLVSTVSSPVTAQGSQLTAAQILDRVDGVENAAADQQMNTTIVLIDKDGKEKVREIRNYKKGSNMSISKFLSPADQKGIGFLSLPDDVMYIYLPAFKKTRRIASHIKNTRFAGTDFTYEDMEAKRFSEKWVPQLLKTENDHYILQLNPKKGVRTDYSKQVMYVKTDNFVYTKVEFYDRGGKLRKIMTRDKIKQVNNYWVATEYQMEDLKAEHKTKVMLKNIKFDSGLSDSLFTERYLKR